jgi:pilus assembly protein FimV
LLFYRRKQDQKNAAHVDSSFLESRLQPDSFFGASGGQRVDTGSDNPASASSMVYSASQLDAADDVDPVAEADVYLAYGRDLQAEEILKEALRHNPGRLAIHTKLLEIFAKRRDAASFQAAANQAFILTGANSPDWTRICEQGLQIDPSNPLYQPGGATLSAFGSIEEPAAAPADSVSTLAMSTHGEPDRRAGNLDLDLDLDFSDDVAAPSIVKPVTAAPVTGSAPAVDLDTDLDSNGIDFDISSQAALQPRPAASAPPENNAFSMDGLSLDLSDSKALPNLATPAPSAAPAPVPASADDGSLQFDLGSLSLDLDEISTDAARESDESAASSHETKLALAEEFVSIGDHDGARALIEEVIADSTGELREKAQRALAKLN